MPKKRLKGCFCPKCNSKIFRRRSIKRYKPKPTECGVCGFIIENPFETFLSRKKK